MPRLDLIRAESEFESGEERGQLVESQSALESPVLTPGLPR